MKKLFGIMIFVLVGMQVTAGDPWERLDREQQRSQCRSCSKKLSDCPTGNRTHTPCCNGFMCKSCLVHVLKVSRGCPYCPAKIPAGYPG